MIPYLRGRTEREQGQERGGCHKRGPAMSWSQKGREGQVSESSSTARGLKEH